LSDRIVLLRGDAMAVELPEQVDACVSEVLGCIGSAEGAVPILERARRWLKPGGGNIPRRCIPRIGAVQLPTEVSETPAFEAVGAQYATRIFETVGHTFDLRVCIRDFPRSHILSSIGTFEDLDFCAPVIASASPRDVELT